MKYELWIALRYLKAKRKEKFISIISLISILGVAVGVMALIVVISVMSGFDRDLQDKIIGMHAHITIEGDGAIDEPYAVADDLKNTHGVAALAPFVNGQAIIKTKDAVTGAVFKGIDIKAESAVTKIGDYIGGPVELSGDDVILGSELMNKLGVDAGDRIEVITQASSTAKPVSLKVKGVFKSGMYEYDSSMAFIDIKKAQEIYGLGAKATGIGVKVADVNKIELVKSHIRKKLSYRLYALSWMDLNRNLFLALRLEKTVMFVILALIVLVACFNIVSTLIMVVMEKVKDIGILKAIGSSNSSVMSIFIMEGFLIGLLGTALGAGTGLWVCELLKKYKFINLPSDIYYFDKLPVLVDWGDIGLILIASIGLSLLSTIYPAYQASRLNPVEALRYE